MESKSNNNNQTKDGTESKAPVSVRVYVGNLSYGTSWQTLKDHFKQCGNVVYADIFRDGSGRSKGCGIIEYETKEESEKAITTLGDTEIDGRKIFVREDRENHSGRKVFVGNLPFTTSWQDLKDEFGKCGNIVRADILMGKDGRPRGQGSILFASEEAAEKAVRTFDNTSFQDRIINVRLWKF